MPQGAAAQIARPGCRSASGLHGQNSGLGEAISCHGDAGAMPAFVAMRAGGSARARALKPGVQSAWSGWCRSATAILLPPTLTPRLVLLGEVVLQGHQSRQAQAAEQKQHQAVEPAPIQRSEDGLEVIKVRDIPGIPQ